MLTILFWLYVTKIRGKYHVLKTWYKWAITSPLPLKGQMGESFINTTEQTGTEGLSRSLHLELFEGLYYSIVYAYTQNCLEFSTFFMKMDLYLFIKIEAIFMSFLRMFERIFTSIVGIELAR